MLEVFLQPVAELPGRHRLGEQEALGVIAFERLNLHELGVRLNALGDLPLMLTG